MRLLAQQLTADELILFKQAVTQHPESHKGTLLMRQCVGAAGRHSLQLFGSTSLQNKRARARGLDLDGQKQDNWRQIPSECAYEGCWGRSASKGWGEWRKSESGTDSGRHGEAAGPRQ